MHCVCIGESECVCVCVCVCVCIVGVLCVSHMNVCVYGELCHVG